MILKTSTTISKGMRMHTTDQQYHECISHSLTNGYSHRQKKQRCLNPFPHPQINEMWEFCTFSLCKPPRKNVLQYAWKYYKPSTILSSAYTEKSWAGVWVLHFMSVAITPTYKLWNSRSDCQSRGITPAADTWKTTYSTWQMGLQSRLHNS